MERVLISYPYVNQNIKKHICRYVFASQFSSGVCLDCACGSGYGSVVLSEKCKEVFGIDKSEEAIDFANKENSKDNILYSVKKAEDMDFAIGYFDTVVSLETIEHIKNSHLETFLQTVDRILKDGGVFIVSSPMLRYANRKPYITSPFHINEMPREELIDKINVYFSTYTKCYFHQQDGYFVPLGNENTGFCIIILRKNEQ